MRERSVLLRGKAAREISAAFVVVHLGTYTGEFISVLPTKFTVQVLGHVLPEAFRNLGRLRQCMIK